MTNKSEEFIKEIYAQTYQLAKDSGISHDFILTQIIAETHYGKYILEGTHNLFNLKANSAWKGETSSHSVWTIEEGKRIWAHVKFRKYTSYKESVKDWFTFLQERNIYRALVEWGELSTKALANKIQDAGYTNNPHYAEHMIQIVEAKDYRTLLHKVQKLYVATDHTHTHTHYFESSDDTPYQETINDFTQHDDLEQDMLIFDIDDYTNRGTITPNHHEETFNQSSHDTKASQIPPWLTIAIEQAKEIHGRNEHQVAAMIRKYHTGATGSALHGANTAWCASFISWTLKEAGMQHTPRSAGSRFFRDTSDGEGFGKGLEPIPKGEERLGDIAVWANLDKDGNYKETGHVSFVIGKDKEGKELFLGGNQGNTLGVKHYATEDTAHRAFVGFFRPKEAESIARNLPHYESAKEANREIIGEDIELGNSTC